MKKNRVPKKIELKKSIISQLAGIDLEKVKGGSTTIATNTKTCPETYLCLLSETVAEVCQ